jgi:hypothetical protein
MFFGLKRRQLPIQLEEHILRHLLGQRRIVNNTPRNAEHHRLVLAHQQAKAVERSLQVPTWNPATPPELNCNPHSEIRCSDKRVCSLSRISANIT